MRIRKKNPNDYKANPVFKLKKKKRIGNKDDPSQFLENMETQVKSKKLKKKKKNNK